MSETIAEKVSAEGKEAGIMELLHWNGMLLTGGLFVTLVVLATFSNSGGGTAAWISLLLLAAAIALLITSADFFIEGAKGLARRAGIAEVVIGLTIVSIGTSLPEILVTSTAAYGGADDPAMIDLAIGNIFGSVLVQITLILGIVVMVRPLEIRPDWLRRDGMLMLGAVVLLSLLLMWNKNLTRWEGALLVSLYIGYIWWLLKNQDKIRSDELEIVPDVKTQGRGWTSGAYTVMVIIGLMFAIYAATQLVKIASEIAIAMKVDPAIVGMTMSGLGTSLPELTVALMASKRSQGVAIGTLIGSNITDPMLSIGIAAMISPLTISASSFPLIMKVVIPATIIGVLACLLFMWTGFKFNRWEGGVLAGLYLLFLVLLEMQRRGYLVI
ncbi:MAG: calcium/sodium antiporter [Candidatus Poseidoniaceae archaeon]|jgi:cation:H+ antiporter|nr:calcium/sodium antiporter [Candidatus Poseidoniaceae archaeon]MDP7202811.1 calcium/sodium antiporter [Candidatus Poseidoniaceae archaeon]